MGISEPPPPRQDRHRTTPSFSSSLLDAIYRSIDESDTDTAAGEPQLSVHAICSRKHSTTSTTSSSSSSSFYFSSSSDADTPVCIKPIRTGPILLESDPIPSDPPEEHTNQNYHSQNRSRNKNLTSIKKKIRELRRSAGPNSPGAKLAGFLNSLFHPAAAGWNPKKPKVSKEPSPCSSANSYSRSCLSKTPSTKGFAGEKRSVRFCPVGVIVGEDCRPCGEKMMFSSAGGKDFSVRIREKGNVMEEEDYDSDSTSSEDLFELEINFGGNLSNGAYRDELPVYETTNLGTNRAIARGLMTL